MDIDTIIKELEQLLPQLRDLVYSNNSFNRYILPAIIAGAISVAGILINNFISVYVFKKKRSLEYGRFYLPYLSYLKDILCEIEICSSQKTKEILVDVVLFDNLQQEKRTTQLTRIANSLDEINKLFGESTYYIINQKINKDVLNLQSFIILYIKFKDRKISADEKKKIQEQVDSLDINIKNHIEEIESNS